MSDITQVDQRSAALPARKTFNLSIWNTRVLTQYMGIFKLKSPQPKSICPSAMDVWPSIPFWDLHFSTLLF
jgi:hypothetical protein